MIKFFSLSLVVAIVTAACSRSPKCWGADKNEGIIKNAISIGCVPVINSEHYVINNDSAYKSVFESNCSLPSIDFNEQTLLGVYASGGCEIKYIREVTERSGENKYHYKVTVKECGACKKLGFSYNWVTVPKLPANWDVTFEVKEK